MSDQDQSYPVTNIRVVQVCTGCNTPVPAHLKTAHKGSIDCAPHAHRDTLLKRGWFTVNTHGAVIALGKLYSPDANHNWYRLYAALVELKRHCDFNEFIADLRLPSGRNQIWVDPHFWHVYVDIFPFLAEQELTRQQYKAAYRNWPDIGPEGYRSVEADFRRALTDESYAEMLRLQHDIWKENRVK